MTEYKCINARIADLEQEIEMHGGDSVSDLYLRGIAMVEIGELNELIAHQDAGKSDSTDFWSYIDQFQQCARRLRWLVVENVRGNDQKFSAEIAELETVLRNYNGGLND